MKQKYNKELAIKYFIQRKIIEFSTVVGTVFILYSLGHLEKWIALTYFPEDAIMCQSFFGCILAGICCSIMIIALLACLILIILLIIKCLKKFISWNWEKAKEKARK